MLLLAGPWHSDPLFNYSFQPIDRVRDVLVAIPGDINCLRPFQVISTVYLKSQWTSHPCTWRQWGTAKTDQFFIDGILSLMKYFMPHRHHIYFEYFFLKIHWAIECAMNRTGHTNPKKADSHFLDDQFRSTNYEFITLPKKQSNHRVIIKLHKNYRALLGCILLQARSGFNFLKQFDRTTKFAWAYGHYSARSLQGRLIIPVINCQSPCNDEVIMMWWRLPVNI
jgi:hypothetical protein